MVARQRAGVGKSHDHVTCTVVDAAALKRHPAAPIGIESWHLGSMDLNRVRLTSLVALLRCIATCSGGRCVHPNGRRARTWSQLSHCLWCRGTGCTQHVRLGELCHQACRSCAAPYRTSTLPLGFEHGYSQSAVAARQSDRAVERPRSELALRRRCPRRNPKVEQDRLARRRRNCGGSSVGSCVPAGDDEVWDVSGTGSPS